MLSWIWKNRQWFNFGYWPSLYNDVFDMMNDILIWLWLAWNSWQVISPVEAVGRVIVVGELLTVQNKSYAQPTILVAKTVKGEEEIPDGVVAVLTSDMPDVLSHVSVRARNGKVIIYDIATILHMQFFLVIVCWKEWLAIDRFALPLALIPIFWLISNPMKGSYCT